MTAGARLVTFLAMRAGAYAAWVLVASVAGSSAARAAASVEASLSASEELRLAHGEAVTRPQDLERGDQRYVGGVGYAIVDGSSQEMAEVLTDVNAYRAILPHTKEARLVGRDGPDALVELTQGNLLFDATFTVRLRREGNGVRFWLDRSLPHGIEDAWGFFRWQPLAQVKPGTPRVLLSYGVLVDVGPGVVRDLFEDKIQWIVLTVPARVQSYVATHVRRAPPRA